MKIAVYPGSFDPVTNGHLDIIARASKICDKLIVLVTYNPNKKAMFTPEERVEMIAQVCKQYDNIVVESYQGLLVEFFKDSNANYLIKGLRTASDFESEFQMACINQMLYDEVETIFMMTRPEYVFLSSSIVKEISGLNGDISKFVPKVVKKAIKGKLEE